MFVFHVFVALAEFDDFMDFGSCVLHDVLPCNALCFPRFRGKDSESLLPSWFLPVQQLVIRIEEDPCRQGSWWL